MDVTIQSQDINQNEYKMPIFVSIMGNPQLGSKEDLSNELKRNY